MTTLDFCKRHEFLPALRCEDQFWGPTSILGCGYWIFSWGEVGAWNWTHSLVVSGVNVTCFHAWYFCTVSVYCWLRVYKPITGLFPQRLQRQAQVTLASLGFCYKSGQCAESCVSAVRAAQPPVFVYLHSSLQSCDWVRRTARFVRLAQQVVMQNDGFFVYVVLLHMMLQELSVEWQVTH